MKIKVPVTTEINVQYIRMVLAVRYEEEDIPNGFPMRSGDKWEATVNIDTGKIEQWEDFYGARKIEYMKVCDEGSYYLLDEYFGVIAKRENEYVPHGIVPGEYGDYVTLNIDKDGVILNWPKKPDLSAFFENYQPSN